MGTLSFGQTVSSEKLPSTRHAARATILEVDGEREPVINIGMRELSEENLQLLFMAGSINEDNQAKGYADQVVPTYVEDQFVDLGHLRVFITKITGAITGTLAVGDTLTGDASGATMKVAYLGSGYVIVVNLSADITTGEQLEKTPDTDFIVATSVEKLEDVCVTDATGATLRVQGDDDDYSIDPDYGYLRQNAGGDIEATDVVSYDYPAVSRKYIHGLSAGSVTKKLTCVTDKDDLGPGKRYTFHKVRLVMNGELPLIGDGVSEPTLQGTVLYDSSQPSGQEYYKVEIMPQAS